MDPTTLHQVVRFFARTHRGQQGQSVRDVRTHGSHILLASDERIPSGMRTLKTRNVHWHVKNGILPAIRGERRTSSSSCHVCEDDGGEKGSNWQVSPPKPLEPGVYLVATPIGNLEDITLRALRILRDADSVFAEDTRRASRLLDHYGIRRKLRSLHAHNERSRTTELVQQARRGEAVALMTDAGTPCISDPGFLAAKEAYINGVRVVPIPGACAFVSAVAASGLESTSLTFRGFPPAKTGPRKKQLQMEANTSHTVAYYVAPHDIVDFLEDAVEVLGSSRPCCLAREVTKVFEEFYRGNLQGALEEFRRREPKGEFTVLLGGCEPNESINDADISQEIQTLLKEGSRLSEAVRTVALSLGVKKNRVYELAMKLQGTNTA